MTLRDEQTRQWAKILLACPLLIIPRTSSPSWFGTYVLMFFITSIGITIVTAFSVYSHSNKIYIFIFFFFFSLTTFTFCWLFSVFFSRAQVGTTVAALVFLGLFFTYFAVEGANTSKGKKTLACLASQVCFGLGAVLIQKLESAGDGVQAHSAKTDVDNMSYNTVIGMFVLDFFLYLFLALYFQQIVPSEWGTHQRPWFCCLPSYWCPKAIDTTSKRGAANGQLSMEMGSQPHRPLQEASPLVPAGGSDRSSYFEAVSEAVRAQLGVSVRGLHKKFHTDGEAEPFIAVKDLNIDLYQGQILALLGHNGAGRSRQAKQCSTML